MSFWDQFQEVDQQQAQPEIDSSLAVKEPPMQIQQEVPSQDFWSQFQEIEKPETTTESALRQAGGAFLAGVTQLAGLPGDIESLIRSATGTQTEEQFFAPGSKFAEIRKKGFEKFEPKGKREELQQEFAGDIATGPKGIVKKLGVAAFGIFGKEAAKELGAGEKGQVGAKIISGVLASRMGKQNVKDFIKKEYKEASAAIPKDASIPSTRAQTYLKQVKEKVNQGGHASWKDEVNKQINALEKNISDGKIKVPALDQSIKDINSQLAEKVVRGSQAEMWLTRIKKAAQHELKIYGKENPEFLKHYKNANAAYSGFAQSKKAANWIEKKKAKLGFGGGTALLAEFIIGGPEVTAKTVAGLATLYGIGKTGELMARIFSNPVLANYYLKATAAAAQENSKQLLVNLNKLDQGLKKQKPQ